MSEPETKKPSYKESILGWLRGETFQRPLNNSEKSTWLNPKKRHNVTPIDRNMLIRYNSSFIELVQPLYRAKGFIEAFYVVFFGLALAIFIFGVTSFSFIYPYTFGITPELAAKWVSEDLLVRIFFDLCFLGFTLIGLFGTLHCLDFLIHNTYPYTHSAIRFCRKNRRVYAYVPRQSWFTKLKPFIDVSWDEAYIHTYNAGPLVPGIAEYRWFLSLYELHRSHPKADPIIVNGVIFGAPAEGSDHLEELMYGQWEFIRRYMEEGPESLPTPSFMLPIAHKRESFFLGWKMLRDGQGNDGFIKLMFLPFTPFAAIMRCIQMHIAPVLKWPAEVEAACKIEADDPYHYEANRKQHAVKVNFS